MADKETKIFIDHIDKYDPWKDAINVTTEDKQRFIETLMESVEPNSFIKKAIDKLPEEDQQKFKEIIDKIIKILVSGDYE